MIHPDKDLLKEWLEKADGDYTAAQSLYKCQRKKKVYYIIAFHCQQTIEKLLKALLIAHGIDFPKIHDLILLLALLKKKESFLAGLEPELEKLSPFSVGFRYPGEDITLSELKEVVRVAKMVRNILLKSVKEFI